MIKVEVYSDSYSLYEGKPDEVLTLKEFEEKYNNDSDFRFDLRSVRFVVG